MAAPRWRFESNHVCWETSARGLRWDLRLFGWPLPGRVTPADPGLGGPLIRPWAYIPTSGRIMSVVTVQLGQCGNQVGQELFDVICRDGSEGKVHGSACCERFFRRSARGGKCHLSTNKQTNKQKVYKLSSTVTLFARPTRVGHCCHRPGCQGGARGHGAQSDQAQHEPGRKDRQVALWRSFTLQPETRLRKQLGQRVGARTHTHWLNNNFPKIGYNICIYRYR